MNDNMDKQEGSTENPMPFNKSCKMCGTGMCCHGHRHFWLRWLLGIIILAAIFCIGVKIGEFKGAFGRDYDNQQGYMMRQRGYPLNQPWGMMRQGVPAAQPSATTTPAK